MNSDSNLYMKTIGIEISSWIEFGNEYLDAYTKLHNYQTQVLDANGNAELFYAEIGDANISEEEVEGIYEKYGIDFDIVLTHQNEMDNSVYRFALANPQILDVQSQEEFQNDLILGIGSVIGEVTPQTPIYSTNGNLTWPEIWGCAVEAVGLGFVSYIGLKNLTKVGATIITKAITKALVKFAGPIGTAIMMADFGFCIYEASQD